MQAIYVIEHLEQKLWPWCLIEYKNISKIAGKENLWFTNVRDGATKLKPYGKVFRESVRKMKLTGACVLDPDSKTELTSELAGNYEYFIFGGILGDAEFNWRTKNELTRFMKRMPAFNLGKGQFSTDNAVFVTKEIVGGKHLNEIPFIDDAEIDIKKGESIILPYRYPLVKGKPQMSAELVSYLKKKKGF